MNKTFHCVPSVKVKNLGDKAQCLPSTHRHSWGSKLRSSHLYREHFNHCDIPSASLQYCNLGQFVLRRPDDHEGMTVIRTLLGPCDSPTPSKALSCCLSLLLMMVLSVMQPCMPGCHRGCLACFHLWLSGTVPMSCHLCHWVVRLCLVTGSSERDSAIQCACTASEVAPQVFCRLA